MIQDPVIIMLNVIHHLYLLFGLESFLLRFFRLSFLFLFRFDMRFSLSIRTWQMRLCGTHFPFTNDIRWAIDPLLITALQWMHRFTCCKPPFPFTHTSLPNSSRRTRNRHLSGSKSVVCGDRWTLFACMSMHVECECQGVCTCTCEFVCTCPIV